MIRRALLVVAILAAAMALACRGDGVTGIPSGKGELAIRLTDRNFPFDSLQAVNVFITRIDARFEEDEDAEDDDSVSVVANLGHGDEEGEGHRFVTIAEPDTTFNLLELRNGVTAFLGTAVVDTGTIKDLRVVVDPSKSSIVLKDGTALTGAADPFSRFPDGTLIVVRIRIDDDIVVRARARTVVLVDFDLEHSFVMRGPSLRAFGLDFLPFVTCRHHDD